MLASGRVNVCTHVIGRATEKGSSAISPDIATVDGNAQLHTSRTTVVFGLVNET